MTDEKPSHLDLFSGIGGFALAARWAGFRTIGFCEIDKYCQKILSKPDAFGCHWRSNNNGSSPPERNGVAPVGIANIFELDGRDFYGVSLITGGFPCQPFSVAGKRRGAEDDRAIWPEMLRVISEARPAWVLGENVPGIIPMELDNVLSDLERIGYATRSFVIPACAVDARHRRDRLWIVARLADTAGARSTHDSESSSRRGESWRDTACRGSIREPTDREAARWEPEPDVGRVAHGIPNRVERLKGLGNAIVPQVAYEILKEIRKMI